MKQIACPAEGRTRGPATDADARSAAPVWRVRLGNTDFRFKINCNFWRLLTAAWFRYPFFQDMKLSYWVMDFRCYEIWFRISGNPIRYKFQDSQTSVHNIKVFGALNGQDNGDYTLLRRQIQPNGIQKCIFKSSGMWRCLFGLVQPTFRNIACAFIVWVNQLAYSKRETLTWYEYGIQAWEFSWSSELCLCECFKKWRRAVCMFVFALCLFLR
jgi:hypothetical protein